MLYMVIFTSNISPMLAYIPYIDPMGSSTWSIGLSNLDTLVGKYLAEPAGGTPCLTARWR